MPIWVNVSRLTKGDVIGRLRGCGMCADDLRDVAGFEFKLAKDDRLSSFCASCAIHRASSSSSAASSSSESSVTVGWGSRCGSWIVDETVMGVMVALTDSAHPSLEVLCGIEADLNAVLDSLCVAVGAVKLQDELAKYAGSRLFVSE